MAERVFEPLPSVPDHPALEREVLDWWDQEGIFDRLRERNAGGPKWSFIDGPITANNPMGVHHAWGRTLKDVFQRYKALRGFRQRFQNGFDCQGLHVEVEVERSLGLNSKREIEAYGLAEFAERCKERVARFSALITEQSRRLGMWMDWSNSYYTFSDTNIEYIWRFLKTVEERGWLYKGHRSTLWCPRCGTSLSHHEQAGEENYKELEHPSLYVRFPLEEREGEALIVWTTTPWTLPANVAAAVKPDAEYGLRDGGWRLAEADADYERVVKGQELLGLTYEGPFDHLPSQAGIEHRVIPWSDVSMTEGTGVVHIAPGAGTEDFELSRLHDLPVLVPIDEAGRMLPEYGELAGLTTDEVEEPVIESLRERGLLVDVGRIVHRYPICWRCKTPLLFRVVDDWFISAGEIRQPLMEANATVEWTPAFYSKRMDDWLRNMGDWNISRKRYFGLPLPFYPCECGHLNVIGSREELEQRATAGLEGLQELHRPWIDDVTIRCEQCDREVRRIPEVGDAWLDAGIVPFSTLGWRNPEWKERGNATGAAAPVTGADLPDHAHWEEWFPADWVSESREQIRLWFYSMSFMGVTLEGRSPYRRVLAYERVRDETGREMHKSTGNAIEANEAIERMGADVMRFIYSEQVPSQNVNFGYGPANEVKRRLLTFWNSVAFLVTYANIEGFRPRWGEGGEGPPAGQPLDRWLVARTNQLVGEANGEFDRFWTPGVVRAWDSFVDDLSNWYIRRSRRRFYGDDQAAFSTLWWALVRATQLIAPVMPFLAEHVWQTLVARPCPDAPASVFLAGWPELGEMDEQLLAEVGAVRRIVELGRQARAAAGLKLRQPLRTLVVQGASLSDEHAAEVRDELRVKEVAFGDIEAEELVVKPNLPVLGPKLGSELGTVRAALEAGDFEQVNGGFRVAGRELAPDEVLVERRGKEGWALASEGGITVALDTRLDDELLLEGRVLDLVHRLNTKRREAGLELTDRIAVTVPSTDADLLERHGEWIKSEVLAVSIEADGGSAEPEITKA